MDGSTPQANTLAQADTPVGRARYYSPANIFKVERPAIPQHIFADERDQAMAPTNTTDWITLDIGAQIGLPRQPPPPHAGALRTHSRRANPDRLIPRPAANSTM